MFRHRQEGVMYVGDKGIVLAGFNGQNPRVYPASPKYVVPPRQESRPEVRSEAAGQATPPPRRDGAIDAWIAACKKGASALTNFEVQAPVTEAFLLGCMVQRLPGEKLLWDTAQMKVTNNEKANRFVDPPYRNGYTT